MLVRSEGVNPTRRALAFEETCIRLYGAARHSARGFPVPTAVLLRNPALIGIDEIYRFCQNYQLDRCEADHTQLAASAVAPEEVQSENPAR